MDFWWTWPGIGIGIWGWWMMMHAIGSLIFIVFVVVIALAVLRPSGRRRTFPAAPAALSAREQLDQRYARGEIGREEYLEKKADMGDAKP